MGTTPSVDAAPGKPRPLRKQNRKQRSQAKRDADAENYRQTIANEADAKKLRQTQKAAEVAEKQAADRENRAIQVAKNLKIQKKLADKRIASRFGGNRRKRRPNNAPCSVPPSPKAPVELSSKQIDQVERLRALGKEVRKRKIAGQANANRRRFPAAKRAKPSPNRSTPQ